MSDFGRTGVTPDTANRLILDAGELYANIDLTELEGTDPDPVASALASAKKLGATRGGTSFNLGRTFRSVEVDGMRGPTKGFKRREEIAPTLQTTLLEMTKEQFTRFIAGADVTVTGSFSKIQGGPLEAADYISNIALLATYSGSTKPVIIVLKNVLATDLGEMATQDKNEVAVQVTFGAHFDPATPDEEPWVIYHPTTTP